MGSSWMHQAGCTVFTLSMIAILSTMCNTPVMSATISRHVRSTTNDLSNLREVRRNTYDDLYDCHIPAGRRCVLQEFRTKRFADPTAEPANVEITNLPRPMTSEEVRDSSLSVLVPRMHRQLHLYRKAFQKLRSNEEHVSENESNFITEFNHTILGIGLMINFTKNYMNDQGYDSLHNDGVVPEFEDATNSHVFSPRTLHVLIQFRDILLTHENVLDRL